MIVLAILKYIGLGILWLLGILLALFLLVLFIPVVYRFEGSFDLDQKEEAYGQLRVSWFGKLFHMKVQYANQEFRYDGKLFWYYLVTNNQDILDKKDERKKKRATRKSKKEQKKQQDNGKKESEKEDSITVPVPIDTEEKEWEQVDQQPQNSVPNTEEELQSQIIQTLCKEKSEEPPKKRKKMFFPKFLYYFYKKKVQKIHAKLKNIHPIGKLKELNRKRKRLWQWWQFNCTKIAIKNVKRYIKRFLRLIRPRHLKGQAVFGFEDPSLTGKVLGWGAMAYPIYRNHIKLIPDFNELKLETSIKGSGHIQFIALVAIGLQALFDKHLKRTIKQFQKITGGQ